MRPSRKNYTAEQIISKLRGVKLSQGIPAEEAIRSIEVSPQTYYQWRKEIAMTRFMTEPVMEKHLEY